MKNIFLATLFITLLGCSARELNPGGITISYAETQCSDPWLKPGSTSAAGWPNDELRAQAIINYLLDNKVRTARNVRFTEVSPTYSGANNLAPSTGIAICQACTCSSGRRIEVAIDEVDWERAEKLGFSRL